MPASSMRGSLAASDDANGKLESKACLVEVWRHSEDPSVQELVGIPQTAITDEIENILLGSADQSPSAL